MNIDLGLWDYIAEFIMRGFQSRTVWNWLRRNNLKTGDTELRTLMFTDVVGATALKDEVGDHEGVALIKEHHSIVRQVLEEFPGACEISTAGDSFFLTFPKPSEAIRFGLRLQKRLSVTPLKTRIGVHSGEVVADLESGVLKDLHGIHVDICSRVMSYASRDQIVMTRSVYDSARSALKRTGDSLCWKKHGPQSLKGISDPVEICEVEEIIPS